MVINSIETGIVIDHLAAGNGSKILKYLNIDDEKHTVAFLMNATSKRHGRKDVLKITNAKTEEINLAVLGLIDPDCTVNVIRNHEIVEKIQPIIPGIVEDVICCNNPRCITSIEPNVRQIFHLINAEKREYRCEYCDDIVNMKKSNIKEILKRKLG